MPLNVQIKKQYGAFRLNVDFSAQPGEVLALLGASGCGKSATLKCIAGIHRPDWGRIELDGRVLFDSERRIDLPPQKRRVGYLFQQYALFPHMTAEQNIAACLGRLDRKKRRERTAELVALLRLEGAEGLRPAQLSGGQQQRTALARILASQPLAILLDEPLAALDNFLRRQLEPELRDVLERFGGVGQPRPGGGLPELPPGLRPDGWAFRPGLRNAGADVKPENSWRGKALRMRQLCAGPARSPPGYGKRSGMGAYAGGRRPLAGGRDGPGNPGGARPPRRRRRGERLPLPRGTGDGGRIRYAGGPAAGGRGGECALAEDGAGKGCLGRSAGQGAGPGVSSCGGSAAAGG